MGWVAVLDTNKAIGGIWPAKATEGLDIGFKYCMAWEAFMVGVLVWAWATTPIFLLCTTISRHGCGAFGFGVGWLHRGNFHVDVDLGQGGLDTETKDGCLERQDDGLQI